MIKLKIVGRRNQRTFRVIVQEDREKLEGKFAEDLGWYNPKTSQFKLNKDRVAYWIGNGAKPTDSVANLLEKVKDSEIGSFEGREGRKRKKGKRKEGAETQAQTDADTQTQTDAEAQAQTDTETQAQTDSEAQAQTPLKGAEEAPAESVEEVKEKPRVEEPKEADPLQADAQEEPKEETSSASQTSSNEAVENSIEDKK